MTDEKTDHDGQEDAQLSEADQARRDLEGHQDAGEEGQEVSDWAALLTELRTMRVRLDQLAAKVVSEQSREELWPVWSCGHKHSGRDEAIRCKRQMEQEDAA